MAIFVTVKTCKLHAYYTYFQQANNFECYLFNFLPHKTCSVGLIEDRLSLFSNQHSFDITDELMATAPKRNLATERDPAEPHVSEVAFQYKIDDRKLLESVSPLMTYMILSTTAALAPILLAGRTPVSTSFHRRGTPLAYVATWEISVSCVSTFFMSIFINPRKYH